MKETDTTIEAEYRTISKTEIVRNVNPTMKDIAMNYIKVGYVIALIIFALSIVAFGITGFIVFSFVGLLIQKLFGK